jgi:hypothetical protein
MVPSLALLASPLLGSAVWQPVAQVLADHGWHTLICVAAPPLRAGQDALDAFLATLPTEQDLVLVPHSNAGVYVPGVSLQRRVVGAVFVDAVLPPARGHVPVAPAAFLDLLREKADDDGLLPVWSTWWDEADVMNLFPDAQTRALVEAEQQQLPLSYFESTVPIPQGWDKMPGAYLAFGDTYATERDQARQRGWPVSTLSGGHLAMLTDPDKVAGELVDLVRGFGFDSPTS